jgi:hypothetical protein
MRWGKGFLCVPLVARHLLTLLPSAIPELRIYPRGIYLTALPCLPMHRCPTHAMQYGQGKTRHMYPFLCSYVVVDSCVENLAGNGAGIAQHFSSHFRESLLVV